MVSKSYDIHTNGLATVEPQAHRLLLELSPNALSVILWDKIQETPVAVEVYHGQTANANDRQVILDHSKLLGYKDLETLVISAFPNTLPIPAPLYSPALAGEQLELLYGGDHHKQFTGGDVLADQLMVLAWQMPNTLHQFLLNRFKILQIKHLTAGLLQHPPQNGAATGKLVVFGNMVWVVLWKESSLQLARAVEVVAPDDLSYHLLNICRQLGLQPSDISWQISGMVGQDSPLWAAVARFFEHTAPMTSPVPGPEELPAHYFAHLF